MGDGPISEPTSGAELLKELRFTVAQLRHAYPKIASGSIVAHQEFADGLIAPQIRRLEHLISVLELQDIQWMKSADIDRLLDAEDEVKRLNDRIFDLETRS